MALNMGYCRVPSLSPKLLNFYRKQLGKMIHGRGIPRGDSQHWVLQAAAIPPSCRSSNWLAWGQRQRWSFPSACFPSQLTAALHPHVSLGSILELYSRRGGWEGQNHALLGNRDCLVTACPVQEL